MNDFSFSLVKSVLNSQEPPVLPFLIPCFSLEREGTKIKQTPENLLLTENMKCSVRITVDYINAWGLILRVTDKALVKGQV